MKDIPKFVIRIGIMVTSLGLMYMVGGQSLAVYVEGYKLNDAGIYLSGVLGSLITPLYLISVIFSLWKPGLSAKTLCAAGILGLITGCATGFKSLLLWGGISLAAALVSYFGARNKRQLRLVVVNGKRV